ncbi:uncharacterized protein N7503_003318 [Penicillium pulvis]|uniref:uncharacterized protein n=1 Tax=Penicillium pulvis TaxID=1562058 RepID=UPI002548263F|nr:uncharacterized protein N7503_003318 [Penicillium pulvis]KAJ5805716.1 hypothetical protein N7503_003318 [Penicillium pulvis]
MPFKSQELYQYYYQSGAAFAVAPTDPKDDCIALANLDEHALRSTILIAGIHYSWNTGNIKAYDSAFLFHKIESIRSINTWLEASNSKPFICVRQILTICLAEACLGNLNTAETHLNGVMSFFDSHEHSRDAWGNFSDIEVELTNRYLLLTSTFVSALRSRLEGFILLRAAQGFDSNHDRSSSEALKLMKIWHGMEHGGLDTRLKAMRLFPHFFSMRPGVRWPRKVDALPIIDCLRAITEAVDQFRTDPTAENLNRMWNDGGPTKLMMVLVTSHISSFTKDDGNAGSPGKEKLSQPSLQSSWSGIGATVQLYMHSVLNITNGGEPIECRLLYRVLLLMMQDIDQTQDHLSGEKGRLCQSLWLWKVFTGILTLTKTQHKQTATGIRTARHCVAGSCKIGSRRLHEWFFNRARAWSLATEITDWKDVKSVLLTLAWPAVLLEDEKEHAANIWAEVIS